VATTSERTQSPERKRPRFRTVTVRRAERLAPHMVRVTLQGDELEGFETPAPTQHLKLIIPEPGQDRPVLPDPSLPRGAVAPGQPRPLMRTYTIRRYEPAVRELDIDVVLHGAGAASSWAEQVRPGGVVALAGPGGRPYAPCMDAAWYVLAGDESALPAMATLLERLPAGMPVRVVAEVATPADELELRSDAELDVTWLHRSSDGSVPGAMLAQRFERLQRPDGDGHVWLACEAGLMRRLRRHLLDGWRTDPGAMVTRGYWKVGEPNYRDSDYGDD
jgi:NADPH-dependent ferric siderophore reductase